MSIFEELTKTNKRLKELIELIRQETEQVKYQEKRLKYNKRKYKYHDNNYWNDPKYERDEKEEIDDCWRCAKSYLKTYHDKYNKLFKVIPLMFCPLLEI